MIRHIITAQAAAAAATLFLAVPAQGQMEYMAEAMRPQYLSRDLVLFAEGLNLDETQEVIVEAMFDAYEDDFATGWAQTQERLNSIAEKARSGDIPQGADPQKAMLEPVLTALGDWLKEKRQLDDGLLDNVNAILLREQRAMWPLFSQQLYRDKNMHRGRLSGESVDLFKILRDSNFPPSAETFIEPHLAEYAASLDIAMRKRDVLLRGNPQKLFDQILRGEMDRSPDMLEELIAARVEVRDVNDRYIDVVEASLSGPDGVAFRQRALGRGYPRIFRRTPAERILSAAAENDDYAADLHAQIVQLEAAYLGELGTVNDQLLRETRRYEPELQLAREEAGRIRRDGGTPRKLEDPTRDMFKDREELGRRYVDMLRALLSPEEFQSLDGSRRWLPRGERTPTRPKPGDTPPVGPDGVITPLSGSNGLPPTIKPKPPSKPTPGGRPDGTGDTGLSGGGGES
jgi:hypothetical protein